MFPRCAGGAPCAARRLLPRLINQPRAAIWRRRTTPAASKPIPTSRKLSGSGTTCTEPPSATTAISFRFANLRNATFVNGNIKCCDFRDADLSGARFENLSVESSQYARAKTDGLVWTSNWAYGSISTQEDFESWIKDHEY